MTGQGTGTVTPAPAELAPAVPRFYRVASRREDTDDTVTVELTEPDGAVPAFAPGQFAMLTALGVGEVPISVSGLGDGGGGRARLLEHTLRAVGAVTRALCAVQPGGVIGVRGPFGTGWDVASAAGRDLVIVAGGIGLAPLRPVVLTALADRSRYGRIVLLAGARTPGDLLYGGELDRWRRAGVEVAVTVDQADSGWGGEVGLVTALIKPGLRAWKQRGVYLRSRHHDAGHRRRAGGTGHSRRPDTGIAGAQHALRCRLVRALPARPAAGLPGRPGGRLRPGGGADEGTGAVMGVPTLVAVWKFASCDGCQLTLLDCEDELLAIADRVKIAHFTEASSDTQPGPYDVSLVEGSITTAADAVRIRQVREMSRTLVTIGACATAGGVQGLRNFADVREFTSVVYARPEYISTLATSTPIAAHVDVDFELHGCPIDRRQLLEVITALLVGRKPNIPAHSVCFECKQRGNVCVVVAHGTPCLGPVTHAGCGALCPAHHRGCYGCFGPMETPNAAAQVGLLRAAGLDEADVQRAFRTFNAGAPAFIELSQVTAGPPPGLGPRDIPEG